jgi:LCCL domain
MTRALLVLVFLTAVAMAQSPKAKSIDAEKIDPNSWQARKHDGSILNVIVTTDIFTITTKYGTAKVPGKDLKRIEFGVRVSDEEKKKILDSLALLESPQSKVREQGKAELLAIGGKAYPIARKYWTNAGPTASAQLFHFLDQLKPSSAPDDFESRDEDVVYTSDGSVLAGKLELEQFQATLDGKPVDLARRELSLVVHGGSADPGEKVEVVTSIQNLWATHLNKIVAIEVTAGNVGGSVWGSNPYTTDTYLGAAVIHAGVMKAGETGYVKLKILPDPGSYTGSTANGITSSNYGPWQGCYEVVGKARIKKPAK